MNLFAHHRFLIKIGLDDSSFDVPRTEEQYKFLRPSFKFFSSHKSGFYLEEKDEEIHLEVGDLSLKGFKLSWNSKSQILSIVTDELSLYPLMAYPASDGTLWLSNTTAFFPRIEKNYRLNPHAVHQFYTRGYILPGEFMLEGVRRVSGHWKTEFPYFRLPNKTNCYWNEGSVVPNRTLEAKDILESLRESIDKIMSVCRPSEFLFSGGADSRIVSLLLSSSQLKELRLRTHRVEWKTPEEDMDYQVARRWCDFRNWPLEVRSVPKRNSALFDGSAGQCFLTGLYGGEYLGDLWDRMLLQPLMEPHLEFALSIAGKNEILNELQELKKLSELERTLLGKQVFTHSDRSFLSGNTQSGWTSPLANMRVAISPFAVLPFLKHILHMPFRHRPYFELMAEVLTLLENSQYHFPICSQLVSAFPKWQAPASWGEAPKAQVHERRFDKEEFKVIQKEVMQHLADRGVSFCEETFLKNCQNSYIFRRLTVNLFFAFPRQVRL